VQPPTRSRSSPSNSLIRERGLAALAAYYRAIAGGSTWQQAFEAVFGRTIDVFYTEFEPYRAGL
jgi:hypothetical protein